MRYVFLFFPTMLLVAASTGCYWTNGNLRTGCVNGLCADEKKSDAQPDGAVGSCRSCRGGFIGGHCRHDGRIASGRCGRCLNGQCSENGDRHANVLANVHGNVHGNVLANVHGNVLANVHDSNHGSGYGNAYGNRYGNRYGNAYGNRYGNAYGNRYGNRYGPYAINPNYSQRPAPHIGPFMGQSGPPVGTYAYPYYTLRGPRDFLIDNPPSIGR